MSRVNRILIPILVFILIVLSVAAVAKNIPVSVSDVPSKTAGSSDTTVIPETADTVTDAPKQPKEELISIDEYEGHILLDAINEGNSKKLLGRVLVYVVFLDDAISEWDESAENELKIALKKQGRRLLSAAEKYGVELDIDIKYERASIPFVAARDDSPEDWGESALEAAGIVKQVLRPDGEYDEVALTFALNCEGRAEAYQTDKNNDVLVEFSTIYSNEPEAFVHELCHLFGAEDLYIPERVAEEAEKYLPKSIMLVSDTGVIDSYTAYTIGWTDGVTEDAKKFLRETITVTQDEIYTERAENSFTGYGTKEYENGAFYVGDLVDGIPHGKGEARYPSGDVYVGDIVYGVREGYGEYTWADGEKYVGEWKDGKRHGNGKHTDIKGKTKEGKWENGVFVG